VVCPYGEIGDIKLLRYEGKGIVSTIELKDFRNNASGKSQITNLKYQK